ncbi:MAG: hypothetical protein U5M51_16720 [Emticicia sp.]|nr:hypothetical protein [Emticicia sp.]
MENATTQIAVAQLYILHLHYLFMLKLRLKPILQKVKKLNYTTTKTISSDGTTSIWTPPNRG